MIANPKIESLPEDLRAIAQDMLAVKFPEPEIVEEPPVWKTSAWTATTVSNASEQPLTMRSLQESMEKFHQILSEPNMYLMSEIDRQKLTNMMYERMELETHPVWTIGVDLGY